MNETQTILIIQKPLYASNKPLTSFTISSKLFFFLYFLDTASGVADSLSGEQPDVHSTNASNCCVVGSFLCSEQVWVVVLSISEWFLIL